MKRSSRVLALVMTAFMATSGMAFAHKGRTDSNGGHKDNKNVSGLGYYHYHCGGNPAHLHENGVCPYGSNSSSNSNSGSNSTSTKSTTTSNYSATVKAAQEALNAKGYDCGTPDGLFGKKTISAVKAFQKDNGLAVDGKIGPATKAALGI